MLKKVNKTELKKGNTVFFERGSTWSGDLLMKYGVSYSAYVEGAKHIITGSPLDSVEPENWALVSDENGHKIWRYAKEVKECGVIVFNGGDIVAQKIYPRWNGRDYLNPSGEEFDPVIDLTGDLNFVSMLDPGKKRSEWTNVDSKYKGSLYLRCNAGNPGDIFASVELPVLDSVTHKAAQNRNGYYSVDNLHFRCGNCAGLDSGKNTAFQYCEVPWCGGGVKGYTKQDNSELYVPGTSGGGMLLYSSNSADRNNYIHDCESKGIGVVRKDGDDCINILAEGNVIERCRAAINLWSSTDDDYTRKRYEDIVFRNNYLINSCYGWS